jgi:hypothetical protein
MLFEGETVPSTQLPRHYLLKYLGISMPPFLLLGASVGVAASLVEQRRAPRSRVALSLLLLQSWLFLPILAFVVRPPNVYDGLRHFLFLLPALALFHAFGIAWLLVRLGRAGPRRLVGCLAVLLTVSPAISVVRLHPYQMTYFNPFVGGLAGAHGRYETDYWLLSFREGIEWLNREAARHPERTCVVGLATPPNTLETARPFKRSNIELRTVPDGSGPNGRLPDGVDFALLTTRAGRRPFPNAPVVHTVGRRGAVFCIIRGRD